MFVLTKNQFFQGKCEFFFRFCFSKKMQETLDRRDCSRLNSEELNSHASPPT